MHNFVCITNIVECQKIRASLEFKNLKVNFFQCIIFFVNCEKGHAVFCRENNILSVMVFRNRIVQFYYVKITSTLLITISCRQQVFNGIKDIRYCTLTRL